MAGTKTIAATRSISCSGRRKKPAANGDVICKWVSLARERHARDLETGSKRRLWFDEEAAQRVIDFFSNYLRHIKGQWAGQPFAPAPWQEHDILRPTFGWMKLPKGMSAQDAAGIEPLERKGAGILRRYKTCYLEVGRKAGKSTLCAGIGDYMTFADREYGAEVYAAATKRDQAKVIWDVAAKMVKRSPELRGVSRIVRDNIFVEHLDAAFLPLGADADTLDGLNPHCNLIDEYHAHKTRGVADVLTTAEGARQQSMTWFITSAGFNTQGPCYEERKYAQAILEKLIQNDEYFAIIYALDDGDDWTKERLWRKANPGIGVTPKLDYIRRQVKKARHNVPYQNTVLAKHMGIWSRQRARFFDMGKWDDCGFGVEPVAWRKETIARLKGRECKGGLDLGSTSDFTALALAFESDGLDGSDGSGGYILLPWFWLPEESSNRREALLRQGYVVWVRQGIVKYTGGNTTDYDVVRADMNELADWFSIKEVAVDRLFQGAQVCTQLMGDGFAVTAHGQGYLSMASPTKRMEELYLQRRLHHGNNPVLKWMAGNMDVSTDAAGNMKPQKPDNQNPFKIDGIVGSIMALGRMAVAPAKRSKYETEELTVL